VCEGDKKKIGYICICSYRLYMLLLDKAAGYNFLSHSMIIQKRTALVIIAILLGYAISSVLIFPLIRLCVDFVVFRNCVICYLCNSNIC